MRKSLLILLGLVLLLGALFAQGNVVERKYAIAIRDANIRSMPSTQGSIIYVARAGEKMEVLEDLGQWLKVKTPTGAVGYVWANLVRLEVEKIIKKAPTPPAPAKPQPPAKPPVPAPKPAPSAAEEFKPFGFSFSFDYALVSPDEFNIVTNYYNLVLNFVASLVYGSVDQPLEELKHTIGGEGEFHYFVNRNFGIGLGFSFLNGSRGGDSTLTASTNYFKLTQDLKASIYGPFLSLHFVVPAQMLSMDIFATAGYYMGKFSLDYNFSSNSDSGYTKYEDISKGTIGFGAGLKLNVVLSKSTGLFLGGGYRSLKFKDMEATLNISGDPPVTGNLYYVKQNTSIGSVEYLEVAETPPSGVGIVSVRPAEFNFSGFHFNAGIYFRF